MDLSFQIERLLNSFSMTSEWGCIPLPSNWDHARYLPNKWKDYIEVLPNSLNERSYQKWVNDLPDLRPESLPTDRMAWEAWMRMLSMIAHAGLVRISDWKEHGVPARIAVPWYATAQELNRPTVIGHPSLVLFNGKHLADSDDYSLASVGVDGQFLPDPDEAWFYRITWQIERLGAFIHVSLAQLALMKDAGEEDAFVSILGGIDRQLAIVISMLNRMYDGCDPAVFYHKIRPYLSGFEGLQFRGLEGQPRLTFAGGSAAQSSLLQALDAGLGGASPESGHPFLKEMRAYMDPGHRSWVAWLEAHPLGSCLRKSSGPVRQAWLETLERVVQFRNEHLKMVATYILQFSEKAPGTGGTAPDVFLRTVRNRTRKVMDQ
ncbi:hypothetical protein [Pontibacter sp. G13]|uniref:hypothetical protein n=1 Tax=Pontibacter sp. G13 TaxID=3074898 RepID=UPI00288BDF14|nr:hypothetical protein [Pontibacter sp. G13]WNJ18042.1 hypothetical protein RJD25_24565 [Pontibacter sp. G13]